MEVHRRHFFIWKLKENWSFRIGNWRGISGKTSQ